MLKITRIEIFEYFLSIQLFNSDLRIGKKCYANILKVFEIVYLEILYEYYDDFFFNLVFVYLFILKYFFLFSFQISI